jgi:hypothetical protein
VFTVHTSVNGGKGRVLTAAIVSRILGKDDKCEENVREVSVPSVFRPIHVGVLMETLKAYVR